MKSTNKVISFFIVAGLLIIGCGKPPEVLIDYGRITLQAGSVVILRDGLKNPAAIGDLVYKDDIIITEKSSLCDIQLSDNIIRLKEQSKVRLMEIFKDTIKSKEKMKIYLILGKIFTKAKKLTKEYNFNIYTPTAVVGVRGTEFLVENDERRTRVYTKSGTVHVKVNMPEDKSLISKIEDLNSEVEVGTKEEIIIEKKDYNKAVKNIRQKAEKPSISEDEKILLKKQLKGIVTKKVLKKPDPQIAGEFNSMVKVKRASEKSLTGIVNIASQPEGAKIIINNIFSGYTPVSKVLEAGKKYEIKFILPEYEEYKVEIILKKKEIKNIKKNFSKEEGIESSLVPEDNKIKSWTVKKDVNVKGDFILQNGILCFAQEDGKIKAYKKRKLLWEHDTKHLINSSALYYKGKVFIGGNDEIIKSIDINNGNVIWERKVGSLLYSKPIISGGKLYVGTAAGLFYALKPKTGKILWQYKTGSGIFVTPVVDRRRVYFCTENNNVIALNKETGKMRWKKDTGSKVVSSSPSIHKDRIYFGNYKGAVLCLNKKNGALVWKKYLIGRILAPVIIAKSYRKSMLYVGTVQGHFYGINCGTGKVLWHKNLNSEITSRAVVVRKKVYVGLKNGELYTLKRRSGETLGKIKLNAGINSLSLSGSMVLAGTDKGIYQVK